MAKTVVVDIDPNEHRKDGIRIDKLIACDLRTFFDSQPAELGYTAPVRWLEQCQHWKSLFAPVESDFSGSDEIDLYQLAEVLSQALTAGSTLVTDSGLIEVILPTNISFGRDVRCVHPVSQGAMGFALPAAIGAQYAADGPVLAVIGDGSIMMNLQELESIRYQQLPIKILVVNNNAYSIIRRRQKELFRGRSIGTDPSNGVSCPSFEQVATCFGLDYMLIDKVPQLPRGIETLMKHERPVICEVMGKTDQSYIELGFARSAESNRFVRRPLEDQAPFLPRELFLREMIVPPIDQ
jgi:acetolactate synthase-1/2/3 large subunit